MIKTFSIGLHFDRLFAHKSTNARRCSLLFQIHLVYHCAILLEVFRQNMVNVACYGHGSITDERYHIRNNMMIVLANIGHSSRTSRKLGRTYELLRVSVTECISLVSISGLLAYWLS